MERELSPGPYAVGHVLDAVSGAPSVSGPLGHCMLEAVKSLQCWA